MALQSGERIRVKRLLPAAWQISSGIAQVDILLGRRNADMTISPDELASIPT